MNSFLKKVTDLLCSRPSRNVLPQNWLIILSSIICSGTFFGLLASEMFWRYRLKWESIVVVFLAIAPFMLILLTRYISEIRWKDVTMKLGTETDEEKVEDLGPQLPLDVPIPPLTFRDLPRATRKVLRTLWHFQNQSFPDDSNKRWGFKIQANPNSPDYVEFREGANELLKNGLVVENKDGLIF